MDDRAHRAFVGGQEVPRVSTVLEAAGLRDGTVDEEAAAVGRQVHRVIAEAASVVMDGQCDRWRDAALCDPLPPRVEQYVTAACDWFEAVSPIVLGSEVPFGSIRLGYAGVVDLIIDDRGRLLIVDIKTGSLRPSVAIQTAAYARAFDQLVGDARGPIGRAVLHLRAAGGYRYQRLPSAERTRDEAVFLAALTVWRWKHQKGLIV